MNFDTSLGLAPLAGITHRGFRRLVAKIGGSSFFYTEMLNSRIVATQNPAKDIYCKDAQIDHPLVAQLVGSDPNLIAKAITKLEPLGFDAFDINMGCPQKRIVRHGWGAALLNRPKAAVEVVKAARRATKKPLLVKLRSMEGHDCKRLIQFVKALELEGVDAIALHPRSIDDGFKRPPRWEEISILKGCLSIRVLGNGDVFIVKDAQRMLKETGADGILIGRGAVVRPWIFWEIVNNSPWPGEPKELLLKAARYTGEYLPKELWKGSFKLFLYWYLRNWEHHHFLFRGIDDGHSPVGTAKVIVDKIERHGLRILKDPNYFKL